MLELVRLVPLATFRNSTGRHALRTLKSSGSGSDAEKLTASLVYYSAGLPAVGIELCAHPTVLNEVFVRLGVKEFDASDKLVCDTVLIHAVFLGSRDKQGLMMRDVPCRHASTVTLLLESTTKSLIDFVFTRVPISQQLRNFSQPFSHKGARSRGFLVDEVPVVWNELVVSNAFVAMFGCECKIDIRHHAKNPRDVEWATRDSLYIHRKRNVKGRLEQMFDNRPAASFGRHSGAPHKVIDIGRLWAHAAHKSNRKVWIDTLDVLG